MKTKVLFGIFIPNEIHMPDGTTFVCLTYGRLRNEIQGIEGFHHLQYVDSIGEWVIFQFIPLSSEELKNLSL